MESRRGHCPASSAHWQQQAAQAQAAPRALEAATSEAAAAPQEVSPATSRGQRASQGRWIGADEARKPSCTSHLTSRLLATSGPSSCLSPHKQHKDIPRTDGRSQYSRAND